MNFLQVSNPWVETIIPERCSTDQGTNSVKTRGCWRWDFHRIRIILFSAHWPDTNDIQVCNKSSRNVKCAFDSSVFEVNFGKWYPSALCIFSPNCLPYPVGGGRTVDLGARKPNSETTLEFSWYLFLLKPGPRMEHPDRLQLIKRL